MRFLKFLALVVTFSLSSAAVADSHIAVLDVDRAVLRSDLATSYRERIQQDFALDERRLQALSDEGNALQERLKKDGDFLSEEEKRKLVAEVQDKYEEFQQLRLSIQKLQQQREQEFLKEVRPMLDKVLKGLVEELKLQLIVDKRATVFAEKKLDITEQVIERLNKQ